jgi:hypothetical protein
VTPAMSGAALVSSGCRVKDYSNIKQRAPCGGKVVRCARDRENLFPLGPSEGNFTEMWGGGMNS